MVYEVFVRKGNGQVIHELYKKAGKAAGRFLELTLKFPEVSLDKKNKRHCCQSIEVM